MTFKNKMKREKHAPHRQHSFLLPLFVTLQVFIVMYFFLFETDYYSTSSNTNYRNARSRSWGGRNGCSSSSCSGDHNFDNFTYYDTLYSADDIESNIGPPLPMNTDFFNPHTLTPQSLFPTSISD